MTAKMSHMLREERLVSNFVVTSFPPEHVDLHESSVKRNTFDIFSNI